LSIVTTPDTLTIFLVVAIFGIVGVPLLLFILATLTSLLQRVLGINLGPPLFLLGIPAAFIVASLALDNSPQVRTAQIIDKYERVHIDARGSWSEERALLVRYAVDGKPLPPVKSAGDGRAALLSAGSAEESTTLHPDARRYDHVRLGDPVQLRILYLRGQFGLARPAGESTRTQVPWNLVQAYVAIGALVLLAWRLRKTVVGYALIAMLVLAAFAYPLVHARQVSAERNDLSRATQHATATVVNATRVTEIDLSPRNGSRRRNLGRHTVPQPYDIVQLEFVPIGYPDTVLAVDAVDVNTAGGLAKGARVDVVYAPDEPHNARISGQSRTHYWRTTVGVYMDDATYYAVIVLLLVVGVGIVHVFRRRTRPLAPGST